MQVYGLQLISLDITIRKKSGSICLKPLNGWRKGCFIVNHIVPMN